MKNSFRSNQDYLECVDDLMQDSLVRSMEGYIHHREISCLEHSLDVSYKSFLACKRLGLDHRSAARGGLLHDFYLYDWHTQNSHKGLHGFNHPRIALENANHRFVMSALENDIILKHMWPLTMALPKHRETFVVLFVDKYCACLEIMGAFKRRPLLGIRRLLSHYKRLFSHV